MHTNARDLKMVAWLKLGHVTGIITFNVKNYSFLWFIANVKINSDPGWKPISQSELETPGWWMKPKACPKTHDMIWFDLSFDFW